jgi:opacity protein-like surface antigen
MRETPLRRESIGRLLSILLLILLAGAGPAFPQESDETGPHLFRVGVTAGVTTFALGDLRDFTNTSVSGYRDAGMPMEVQREYPMNLTAGGEVAFLGLDPLAIGFSGSYTWTSAYARYGDYAGTLDLTSRVKVFSGMLLLQYAFSSGSVLQPFADVRAGISRVSLSLEEIVDVSSTVGLRVDSDLSGAKTGFVGEVSAGLRYTFGWVALAGRAGYRYANVSSMEVEITSLGQSLGSGPLGFDLNTSGFVALLGVEIVL